jgi:flavin reductase (DIM6/NTAB) family NADH-FMN oxidoreductase RutF
MLLESISNNEFTLRSISAWEDAWFLLTCGDFEKGQFNAMTISWGSIGVIWNKPFVQVVVRPTRYTYTFMEKYPDFTVCAFGEEYRKALQLLGSKSGRKMDKISASKLTPIRSQVVSTPSFAEANLVLECRKIYQAPFLPASFLDPDIENCYSVNDYHTSYFGEILKISGDRSKYTS